MRTFWLITDLIFQKNNEEVLMSDTQAKMAIRTFSKPLSTQYDVMFDRQIDNASEWHEEMYVLRQLVEGDLCQIHINSGGGALSTFSAVQHVMKNSPAHFHAILEGDASSAASMLFLIADSQEVSDFAEMMIHQAQVGYGSHAQGFKSAADMLTKQNQTIIHEVYKDFLTEEEIADVLKGAEIWLDSSEIKERLEKRTAIREEREKIDTLKSYNVETLAAQYLQDLLTDCQYLDYNTSDVVKSLVEQLDEIPKALQKGTLLLTLTK